MHRSRGSEGPIETLGVLFRAGRAVTTRVPASVCLLRRGFIFTARKIKKPAIGGPVAGFAPSPTSGCERIVRRALRSCTLQCKTIPAGSIRVIGYIGIGRWKTADFQRSPRGGAAAANAGFDTLHCNAEQATHTLPARIRRPLRNRCTALGRRRVARQHAATTVCR